MSKNKLSELKYVWMAGVALIVLVTGSVIVDFNYIDAAYLFFLMTCIVRYIIICRNK